ncbi:MAG: hypothetical protein EVB11_02405 [Winogradskyella sp.]|nr:MAG: hypothetical protein EVB11_02405 [Winogradskyella sp.]
MTSGLRKAHKFIWLLLIIIIPMIMFFSIKDLNIFSIEGNTTSQIKSSKKSKLYSFENDIIKGAIFESEIEIILKSTLKNSSSIVYGMDEKGNRLDAIGQLTTVGIYNFNINSLPKGIIIFDDIKQVEITKLNFKWD